MLAFNVLVFTHDWFVYAKAHTHTPKRSACINVCSSKLGHDICAYSEFNYIILRLMGIVINTPLATGRILQQTMQKPTMADCSISLVQFSAVLWVY